MVRTVLECQTINKETARILDCRDLLYQLNDEESMGENKFNELLAHPLGTLTVGHRRKKLLDLVVFDTALVTVLDLASGLATLNSSILPGPHCDRNQMAVRRLTIAMLCLAGRMARLLPRN
ncbi:hypothetical protein PoB_000841900 [Plakobranchus ocellatus]|uniref:Uncharacterized protein n=1 Tax=Plakobranchus ocellatus TaxID=259542 RepID=A0AAV3YFZ8_9GAST|nr:hypothetical protein PoB_000841900 [Plakobranchus ocellatus]